MNETISVELDKGRQLDHYDEIRQMTRVVRQLEEVVVETKKRAKAAKDDYDEAASQLIYLIERGPDPQGTLFDTRQHAESWRALRIADELDDLSPATIQILEDAGIKTLGGLAEWTEHHALEEIKGIGPKAAETIAQASAAWFEWNPGDYDE